MPRPLHSHIRDAFVAALLVVLLVALPGAGSPLALLGTVLEVALLVALAAILASLEIAHHRGRRPAARKVPAA